MPARNRRLLLFALAAGAVLMIVWLRLRMPRQHDHPKAAVAQMKSDLRNLVTAEENYFADHHRYTATMEQLSYSPDSHVTVTLVSADSLGWSAMALHSLTPKVCGVFVGAAAPPLEGSSEGEPKCQ